MSKKLYKQWLEDQGIEDHPGLYFTWMACWNTYAKPAIQWINDNVDPCEDAQRDAGHIEYPSDMIHAAGMLPPHVGTLYFEDGEIQECNIPQRDPERSAELTRLLDGEWEQGSDMYYNIEAQDESMPLNANASKAIGFSVYGPVIDLHG